MDRLQKIYDLLNDHNKIRLLEYLSKLAYEQQLEETHINFESENQARPEHKQ